MQRLMYLKTKFKRNLTLFGDYRNFMIELIMKGYASKADERPQRKTWFFPHHGVYHPSKPGKIRVNFDCSAEFDKRSLNKELLTDPDLIFHCMHAYKN